MMDECKNCIARGKVAECMSTPCTKHENWYVTELRKELGAAKAIDDIYIYTVQAYRYGNKKGYNFPVGAFDAEKLAVQWACAHASNRGGKYAHVVCRCKLNQAYDAEEGVVVFDSCKAVEA